MACSGNVGAAEEYGCPIEGRAKHVRVAKKRREAKAEEENGRWEMEAMGACISYVCVQCIRNDGEYL